MLVSDKLLESILLGQFGLPAFRPKQKEVIDSIFAKRHTLALLPTGYGKSLCYQLPSQILPGLTLVISPLIALMQDQLSGLKRRGVLNATVLNSHITPEEQSFRLDAIKAGAFKLIYAAPERFESHRFRRLLESLQVSLIVVDEAHCISQWGHDFRPHYRILSKHLQAFPDAVILALTATATSAVQSDIVNILKPQEMQVIQESFDRPNLQLKVLKVADAAAKDRFLSQALAKRLQPAIVYTSSRREAETVASRLSKLRINAAHYHAGMSHQERSATQKNFENDIVPVIVSTVALGMGMDKPNIRQVFHYNMPGSIESYYQEAGRAGRDGLEAECTLLFQIKDVNTQRSLIDRSFPSDFQINEMFKLILAAGSDGVRVQELSSCMKIGETAFNNCVDLLKQQELIEVDDGGIFLIKAEHSSKCKPNFKINIKIKKDYLHQRIVCERQRLEKMVQYCQKRTCRRLQILQYFGQSLSSACTGCDVCGNLAVF